MDVIDDGIMICLSVEHLLNKEGGIIFILLLSVNDAQPLKTPSPIDVTDGGIDIKLRDKHPLKAFDPIDVIEGGIVISFIDVHLSKAFASIDWIPSIKVIFVTLPIDSKKLLKSFGTISVIVVEIITCFSSGQSLNASFLTFVLYGSIIIIINLEHLLNAFDSINSTDDGISIFSKDMQPSKAFWSISVIEEGISICVNDEQSLNAFNFICLTELGITIFSITNSLEMIWLQLYQLN